MMRFPSFLPLLTSVIVFASAGLSFADKAQAEEVKNEESTPPDPEASETGRGNMVPVRVVRLSEDRISGRSGKLSGNTRITLEIEVPFPEAELLRIELSKATDSDGNDVINAERKTVETVGDLRSSDPGLCEASVTLKNAARKARAIAEITGTAFFHDASKAQPPLLLEDFRKHAGEFTPNEALKEQGISIAFLDAETFDEKGGVLLAGAVLGNFGLDQENAEQQSLAMAPLKLMVSTQGILAFVIADPDKRLARIEGLTADEEAPAVAGMESVNGLWIFSASDDSKKIDRLRVHLRSEGAEVPYSFRLTEIPLP